MVAPPHLREDVHGFGRFMGYEVFTARTRRYGAG
jgi:hypothetical protein